MSAVVVIAGLARYIYIDKAMMAIDMIIEQGEGSGQMDPTFLKSNELAHFLSL